MQKQHVSGWPPIRPKLQTSSARVKYHGWPDQHRIDMDLSNAIVLRLVDIFVHLIQEQRILDSSGMVRSNHPVMGKILEGVKVVEVAQYVFVPRL
ncbi:MAG: hypothetical protein JWO52_7741 [Gammaproteobacteria bacterium]|nr:hypothetical protein [Gammaproteobacteria bacterium]